MDRPNRSKEDIYDVSTYTDQELYDILDVNSPTDRELEAKILFLIHKYDNLQNESGNQLSQFFNDIYKHFFEDEEENENDAEEENTIAITENPFSKPLVEGVENMDDSKKEDKASSTSTSTSATVGYTKTLDYSQDKLNPLLQQTTKRIISIDSQYRDNKKNLSSNFTLQLSEPLKDVVSMKLYSVQIPYTWYTISTDYGSNFFYLKGNVPGIDNGNHDYMIDISAGNPKDPSDLADKLNASISRLKISNTDVSFGDTNISYNSFNSRMTTTIDINKQFNETSYQLIFPDISSSSPFDIDTKRTGSNNVSIAEFLGFANKVYTPYLLNGASSLPLIRLTTVDDSNIRSFTLTNKNNYFTVYKYIGPNESDDLSNGNIDLSFNVKFSLTTGQTYTRNDLITDISNQMAINSYLDSRYSYIQRFDVSSTTLDVSMTGYNTNSFFQLAIKPNRTTTNNIPYSKTRVVFSNDPSFTGIWYGATSCFQFSDVSGELNNILSDGAPIGQQNLYFIVSTNPYIQLNCIKPGFDLSINSYKIPVANSSSIGYKLADYLIAINNGISAVSNSSNQELNTTFTSAFLDTAGSFNLTIDLTKRITQSNFIMDLSGWIDSNGDYYTTQSGGTGSYYRVGFFTDLNSGSAIVPDQLDLSTTTTIDISINTLSSFTFNSPYIASFQSSETTTSKVTNFIKYNIPSPTGNYTLPEIGPVITSLFNNFIDSDGKNIFSGTTFTTVGPDINNITTGTLNIVINKNLSQNDYNIQFMDLSYVTQKDFYMDVSGQLSTIPNNELGFLKTCLGLSGNLGYNGYTASGGIYDMSSTNVFSSSINLTDITSVFTNSSSLFTTDYLAYFKPQSSASYQYGDAIEQNTKMPYDYWVSSPTTSPYDSSSTVLVSNVESLINQQFASIQDLCGTNINMRINGSTVDCSLTVLINQPYNKYVTESSWYRNLYVDQIMIEASYNLYNNPTTSIIVPGRVISYVSSTSGIGIRAYRDISQNQLYLNSTNNYFKIVPFEDGVSSAYYTNPDYQDYNTTTITIPYSANGIQIPYTRDNLISAINTSFNNSDISGSVISIGKTNSGIEFTKIRLSINKQYGAKDYRVVFYDPYSFAQCSVGSSTIRNTTWDSTVGWILGYRESTVYLLSELTTGLNSVQIIGDTGVSTNLYNYFLICLDDFNQNHLNDGLVTITPRGTTIPLPAYANKTNFTCDPVTGQRSYSTAGVTDYKRLTQNQIYSITEIANSSNSTTTTLTNSVSIKSYSQGPYVQDLFAIIPLRLVGLANGAYYVDNGGSLQNQQRIYFGPVNLYKLSVKLVDDRGNIVNLNNANWSFSILCEMLYKPKPSAGT